MSPSNDSLARSSPRLTAALFFVWFSVQWLHGQSRETAFGTVQEYPTPGKFERITLLENSKNTSLHMLLWSRTSTRAAIAEVDSTGRVWRSRPHILPIAADDIQSADVNGDNMGDLILTNKAQRRILIITNLTADTLVPASVLPIPFDPINVVVGDVNNDRRPDLLVFDREQPGILPFVGQSQGAFRRASLIAPDNAVAKLVLVHLNNDFLRDIVFYDWVKSELHLLYGVGQGKFIDQTTIPVTGELTDLLGVEMSATRIPSFLLQEIHPPQIQWLSGDRLGAFRLVSTIKLKGTASTMLVGDVNNDGFKDLLVHLSTGPLQVFYNLGEERSQDGLEFSIPAGTRQVMLWDVDRNGKLDALVLDHEREKLLMYYNADRSISLTDSLEYVTGVRPEGVIIEDFNQDGINDVALVNAASNSVSIFFGRGKEGLSGQLAFSLPASPNHIDFVSTIDSVAHFLISYPRENLISLWSLNLRDNSTVNAVIPTAGESELLYSALRRGEGVDFFAYNGVTPVAAPSLAFFQQLGPKTFIERSFRLTIPDALLGAAVEDLNRDGLTDVVYAYRNVSTSRYEIAVSLGDSTMSFRRKAFSFTLPDSTLRRSYFWMSDCDGDGSADLLYLLPLTSKKLFLARGRGDATFAEPLEIASGLSVSDRSQVKILDLDGDGIPDIAINDLNRKSLGWLKGKGNCIFEEWRPLVGGVKIGSFAFGDLTGDGIPDLAITITDKGILKLYNGRLFFSTLTEKLER